MKRFIIAGLAVGLIAALSIGLPSQGSAAPKKLFIGAWEATDVVDGSHMVMGIGGGGGSGVYHLTLFDDMATLACPLTWASATAIGFGSADEYDLHVQGLIRCPRERMTYSWDTTFVYDPSEGTLTDPLGVIWYRIGH